MCAHDCKDSCGALIIAHLCVCFEPQQVCVLIEFTDLAIPIFKCLHVILGKNYIKNYCFNIIANFVSNFLQKIDLHLHLQLLLHLVQCFSFLLILLLLTLSGAYQ